ncbi:MAG: Xylose operon regulatory protein [Planctomycetota bacterium]|jgi:DNA-binding LacI/PurR family transcriptional regulator
MRRTLAVLLAPLPLSWGSHVALAMHRLARASGWSVRILVVPETPRLDPRSLDGVEAIIAECYTAGVVEAMAAQPLPVLALGTPLGRAPFPQIGTDSGSVGVLAVDHLSAAGCTGIACLGHPRRRFSATLMEAARQRAHDLGLPFAALLHPELWRSPVRGVEQENAAGDHLINGWLRTLAPGTGIISWGDHAALGVHRLIPPGAFAEGARMLVSAVDSPFLLGVEPEISSIAVDLELFATITLGAAIRLADGTGNQMGSIQVPVQRVHQRETTMPLHQADPLMAEAIRRIAGDPDSQESIAQVADDLGISRRTVERHFRTRLGMSPAQYRIRKRMERARALMASGIPRSAAARMCGLRQVRGM